MTKKTVFTAIFLIIIFVATACNRNDEQNTPVSPVPTIESAPTPETAVKETTKKPHGDMQMKDMDGNVVLTVDNLESVEVRENLQDGVISYEVHMQLTPSGTKLFADITSERMGQQISIVVDGKTVCSPTVATVITDGHVVVTGMETNREAQQLVDAIWGE